MTLHGPEVQDNAEEVEKNPEFQHLTQIEDVDTDYAFESTPEWIKPDINNVEEETKPQELEIA